MFCLVQALNPISLSAAGLNLEEIINSGLKNNYELKMARENLLSSRLETREKQGYFTPSLSFSGYHTETEQFDPTWSYTITKEYSASLTQPLFNSSLARDQEESLLNERTREALFLEVKEKAVFDMMMAVFRICRMLSQQTITEESLKFVEKSVSIQQKLATASYGSKIDILEAEVELARYQKENRQISNKLSLELLNLSQTTQQAISIDQFPSVESVSESEFNDDFPRDAQYWIDAALQNSTKLVQARLKQELGHLDRDRSYDTFKPTMDLSFVHTISEDDSVTSGTVRDNAIKLSFSVSFTPLASYYQLQRLDVDQAVLVMEETKAKKELQDQIYSQLESLKISESNLEMQKKWVVKQEEIINLYRKGFEKKHFPISKILDLSRKYNESMLELAKTRIDTWEIKLQLFYLSGLLDKKAITYFSKVNH